MKQLSSVFIKFLGAIFLVVSVGCGSSNPDYELTRTTPFSLENVYAQSWVGGTQSAGRGINLYFTLGSINDDIEIDSVYFRKHIVKARKLNENRYEAYIRFRSNPDRVMDIDPTKEAKNIPNKPFPFELEDDQAVISYFHYGKTRYFKIKKMEIKEEMAYPSTNNNLDN